MKNKPLILSQISFSDIERYRGKKSFYIVRCRGPYYQILERYNRYFSTIEKAQKVIEKFESKNKNSEFFPSTKEYLYYIGFDWIMDLLKAEGKIKGASNKER